jgi:hypothetical protein
MRYKKISEAEAIDMRNKSAIFLNCHGGLNTIRGIADIQNFVIFEKLLELSGYQAHQHDNNPGVGDDGERLTYYLKEKWRPRSPSSVSLARRRVTAVRGE